MRIFVTGASGFLGSYLVDELVRHGHEVAVLLRPDSSDPWRLSGIQEDIVRVSGTLNAISDLRGALERFKPEAVAHLAWRGVGNRDRNSSKQVRNIVDAAELVEVAADVGASVFVGAGSQAEYGPIDRAIRTDDETRPTTLYGKAKLAAGDIAGQIAENRGMRFAWVRIFSTYGPKDSENWLIPSAILTMRRGEHMSLTKCEQKWGFLHARDAAVAFRLVLTSPSAAGFFNLGNPHAPLLRDTLFRLRELVNPGASLGFGDIPYRSDQVMVLQADTSRLSDLGWSVGVSLDDGLRETVSWYVNSQRS